MLDWNSLNLPTHFLVYQPYVPFSKISHYAYWFFVRYYVGKQLWRQEQPPWLRFPDGRPQRPRIHTASTVARIARGAAAQARRAELTACWMPS